MNLTTCFYIIDRKDLGKEQKTQQYFAPFSLQSSLPENPGHFKQGRGHSVVGFSFYVVVLWKKK